MEGKSITRRKGMDRLQFVTTAGAAAAAVALGPTILIKRPQKSLKIMKWLHCMILSDFCGRLIRMVGPSATAAAAAPAVVTNCSRSIPFRLVMDLPSMLWNAEKRSQESGVRA